MVEAYDNIIILHPILTYNNMIILHQILTYYNMIILHQILTSGVVYSERKNEIHHK